MASPKSWLIFDRFLRFDPLSQISNCRCTQALRLRSIRGPEKSIPDGNGTGLRQSLYIHQTGGTWCRSSKNGRGSRMSSAPETLLICETVAMPRTARIFGSSPGRALRCSAAPCHMCGLCAPSQSRPRSPVFRSGTPGRTRHTSACTCSRQHPSVPTECVIPIPQNLNEFEERRVK